MIGYLVDKNICCGCGACENVCPTKAIAMGYDNEGFLYPNLEPTKCVDCRACERVCPVKIDANKEYPEYLKTYAGYSMQKEVMERCTSGGFATELSQLILQEGGVVFGVRYAEDYVKAEYVCVTQEEDLLS